MAEETVKPKISIKTVQEDLKNGLDRKAIGLKYGLNFTQTKLLFSNEGLKGLRTKKPVEAAFELVDDRETATATTITSASTSQAQEEGNSVEEKPKQEPVTEQDSPAPSGKISEVVTEADNLEEKEDKVNVSKGLW